MYMYMYRYMSNSKAAVQYVVEAHTLLRIFTIDPTTSRTAMYMYLLTLFSNDPTTKLPIRNLY